MKKNRRTSPIRKRSYLLFELLLALGLLTLTLFPLVRSHVALRKAEYSYLQKLEKNRLSQCIFCAMKSELYMWKHSWKELEGEIKGHVTINGTIYPYELKNIKKHNHKNGMVVEAKIELPEHTMIRTLYISR